MKELLLLHRLWKSNCLTTVEHKRYIELLELYNKGDL
jgi:hypothetical protein